jgi:uncharacterized protein
MAIAVPVLIDGYNLMNIAGILGRGIGPGSLERSRLALLNFLAESLDPKEIAGTMVVFDASDAPPGLPRVVHHRGLTVHFASQYPDADSLIEELIGKSSAPRRLTVVSSDHRIQRAARRRRAKPMDCDVWYAGVVARRERRRRRKKTESPERPHAALLEEDIAYWIRQFGGEEALDELLREASPPKPPEPPVVRDGQDLPHKNLPDDFYNPFPPGYGEDLEE